MNFAGVRILCVGDVMLDRFIYGDVERISPEAPVPVLRIRDVRTMLGGVGNVAHNIASLGGEAMLVGLVGIDDAGATLRRQVANIPGITPGFVESRLRPTICKTRFLASQQQVVRTDEESRLPMQEPEAEALLLEIERAIGMADAVILSDYGKGVLGEAVIAQAVAGARGRGIPVFVDPKSSDFSRYRGATCITPNLKELAAAAHLPVGTEEEIVAACRRVMAQAESAAILATRSEKGMTLVEANGEVHSVPARAREVFDVSGAGDTVIATMALAHASGLSLPQSMRISNAAAGVVVSKIGTATVEPAELLHELDDYQDSTPRDRLVIRSPAEASALVERWKQQGLTVGFTNGCFDILHAGHIALLAAARGTCDRLVVALNTDASVARLKGPSRPINSLEQRCVVMAAIKYVDCIVTFDEETPLALIRRLLPDVLVKGADYRLEEVVGGDVVQQAGGRVFLCELVAGQSTTRIVERIKIGETVP
ncbi:MAG: bifunctional D-glycero-beta-D-manno-heptose-7-phosphate kinase/D-glycero-beta-D-manno-heptose 1-phosphate adenylyltransferase HldE [Acidisphaera sp.]|nr:bifunctional D-glycero-beta-D-manno-heptose-7-phosphate kinase/D-glycero-beta-D-manno-heptose 1-phosphate adenylyltransferase HldE [Acidisphaera sp.]